MHRNIRLMISLAIACVGGLAIALLALPAAAGANGWTAIGPPDTNNLWGTPFAVDPSSPSTIYAVRNGTTIMKTSDSGGHWDTLTAAPAYVKQIVIDPATPATIYAVGGTTAHDLGIVIYKSTDAGVNWVRNSNGLPPSPLWVAIAPSRSSTLYAVMSYLGVSKSTDGGLSWTQINNGLPAPYVIPWGGSLAVDPTNADTAYVVTYGDGGARIFKLSPGADQWRELSIRFPVDATVNALAIDPVTPSIVYASYSVTDGGDFLIEAGTFKTIDGGETWMAVPNPGANNLVFTFAIDPRAPWRIYAAMNYGVYMSTDAGASWTAINAGLPNLFVWGLYIDSTGSTLRTASYAGLFEYHPTAATPPPVQTAIEYGFRSVWDYGYSSYFVTASPAEIAALDRGGDLNTASGLIWERTGESFGVWAYPANGALPTCRFFYSGMTLDQFTRRTPRSVHKCEPHPTHAGSTRG